MAPRSDPYLVALQIVVLQSWFYICQGVSQFVWKSLFATYLPMQLSDIFLLDGAHRWSTISAHITALPAFIALMCFVIEHPAHVVDFVFSAYLIHFVVRLALFSFPKSTLWWLFTISEAVVVAFVSECAIARKNHIRVMRMTGNVESAAGDGETVTVATRTEFGAGIPARSPLVVTTPLDARAAKKR